MKAGGVNFGDSLVSKTTDQKWNDSLWQKNLNKLCQNRKAIKNYESDDDDEDDDELKFALDRVSHLSAHDALTIVRGALSLPMMYFLRTSSYISPSLLGRFDDVLRTALSAICNEPSGISVQDGKRPNGCTLTSWRAGKCLAWDVTVPGTLAERYVHLTSKECGLAAIRASDEKIKKYEHALPFFRFFANMYRGPWTHGPQYFKIY
ncbi:hypothetical protein HELRODRAFT_170703 [Helobdella robusta]|uniref:Uncharacterized protein n=1 Tax=Helobdella robusta TaxID=6412 RepID=T1F3C1_HELRO|nr:hypothetical protein HELRODRAFT_170703 [Helobdella robusta]ESO07368.1 hypothetical protein HELRODRAFT_170703 [Helobdella robusta]